MMTLVDDILTYAKTGSQDLTAEEVNLQQIVSDKVIDLQLAPDTQSVKINVDLPKQKVKAYPKLIGLVFYNLINNGIKYNQSDTPIINCSYTDEEDAWLFCVEDNGMGIAPKYREVIFEPFKRLASSSIDGSGIGLSTCKRIVTLHNGEIWVENGPSGTTMFKFSIAKNLN
jgi:signal transduction histidine kinase